MDPSNELFRLRCESNPALYTACAIQWIDSWGEKGMGHIAQTRLMVREGGWVGGEWHAMVRAVQRESLLT